MPGRGSLADPLNDGKEKSGGFAGAGFGTADQVLAAENDRNCLSLNRCRFVVSERLARAYLRSGKSQLRKIHKFLLFARRSQIGCDCFEAVGRCNSQVNRWLRSHQKRLTHRCFAADYQRGSAIAAAVAAD